MNWWVTLTADGTAIAPGSGLFAAQQNAGQVQLSDTDNRVVAYLLPGVQAQRIADFIAAGASAIGAGYDANTLILLNAIYAQALAHGLTNRAAYLQPIVDWGQAIAQAVEAASEQVMAATTAAQVAAVTLTLPSAPSPLPTRAGAMAISN